MALRHESAQLLGFASTAEESLATKMASSAEQVIAFLRDFVAKARPMAENDLAELRSFAASELGIDDLAPWDVGYAAEKLRERKYALSEEELKPYFPLPAVLDGLFAVIERVLGVQRARAQRCRCLASPMRATTICVDADGKVFAGAYIDLYARTGKRGGAWMDVCTSRLRDSDSLQLPVAFLTCNFAPPTENSRRC